MYKNEKLESMREVEMAFVFQKKKKKKSPRNVKEARLGTRGKNNNLTYA